MSKDIRFDWQRASRTGIPEVVFAQGKSVSQLYALADTAIAQQMRVLMTRVDPEKASALTDRYPDVALAHEVSRTIVIDSQHTSLSGNLENAPCIAIVAAGTSDHALVAEIAQCLAFLGVASTEFIDVGVAGLWRLTDLAGELNQYPLCVAVAGMEGALFSVLAGLVQCPVIAVPTSVGYGVTAGGHTALNCALGSCAPGIAVVNIDNGFGAAALAVKMLAMAGRVTEFSNGY